MNNVDFTEFNEADVCYEKMKGVYTRLSCMKEGVGSDATVVMNTKQNLKQG